MREIVGYARYDHPEQVDRLNPLYECLDLYANLFLPTRNLVAKARHGARVRKTYDVARMPLDRVLERQLLSHEGVARWTGLRQSLNPLQLHRQLETLITELTQTQAAAMSADGRVR